MALCDYFKLVTTVIVTAVWAMYFLQAMVASPGLLDVDWIANAYHRAKINKIPKMVVVKPLKFIGSE